MLHTYVCPQMNIFRTWKIREILLFCSLVDKDFAFIHTKWGFKLSFTWLYFHISIKPFRWNIHVICRNCEVSSHTYTKCNISVDISVCHLKKRKKESKEWQRTSWHHGDENSCYKCTSTHREIFQSFFQPNFIGTLQKKSIRKNVTLHKNVFLFLFL